MRCPRCGEDNPAGARFCSSCGAPLDAAAAEDAADPTPAPAADPGPPGAAQRLRRGWPIAIGWSFVPLAAAFALALLLSVLGSGAQPFQFAPTPPDLEALRPEGLDVVTGGLIGAYGYHHASITVSLPPFEIPDAPFPGGFRFSGSVSFAPMLGTALVALLLAFAGRATARAAAPGPWWTRPVDGAKVAVPYSLLALALSFAARQSIELPTIPGTPFEGGGALTLAVSPLSAFLWALLLATVFGALGGAWSAPGDVYRGAWGSRARAALAGGWRMTWVALALSFVGLLALAAVHDEGARAYFELVGQLGGAGGASFVLSTILVLPNMATWVTAGALGGSAFSVTLFGSSCSLVTYLRFPSGVRDGAEVPGGPAAFFTDPCSVLPIRFDTAPPGYFLFLLVPLVAVVLGGMHAARRSGLPAARERAAVGAAAGLVFALAFLALGILSDMAFSLDFRIPFLDVGGDGFGFGPGLLSGTALALVWGVVGGALGALVVRGAAPVPSPPDGPSRDEKRT